MELKPCPFCGASLVYPYKHRHFADVACPGCGCRGPEGETEEEAIKLWNTRKDSL